MADDPDRELTIPELLEARDKIRSQLMKTSYARASAYAKETKATLKTILEEVEAELAERGYKDASEA